MLLAIILIFFLCGGGGYWGYNRGYYGAGPGIGGLVILLIVLWLFAGPGLGFGHLGWR